MDAAVSWEFEKTVGLSIDALCKLGITRHGYDSDRNCYGIQFLVFSETSPKPPLNNTDRKKIQNTVD